MAERIKKHWELSLIFAAGLILTITAIFSVFPNPVFGDVSTTIVVTATVQEYLSFTSSATSTTLSPDLVNNAGATAIGSSSNITLTVNTSSADGYTIYVKGTTGTGLTTGGNQIYTTPATTTVAAGTNAFGLQATTTTSGMTVAANFNWPFTGTIVGSASSTTNKTLATETSPGASQIVTIRFLAAATSTMAAGSYQDTIELTAVPTP